MNPHTALAEKVEASIAQGGSISGYYFVFTVGQEDAQLTTFVQWCLDKSVSVKPLSGKYNGKLLASFIASFNDLDALYDWFREDESILVIGDSGIHGFREATLYYMDGHREAIGMLHSTTKADALSRDSWSYDSFTNTYFVVD